MAEGVFYRRLGGMLKAEMEFTVTVEAKERDMTNRAAEILKKTELFMRNGAEIGKASAAELHDGLARAVVNEIADDWRRSGDKKAGKRRAYYFSAEFLMGRCDSQQLALSGAD